MDSTAGVCGRCGERVRRTDHPDGPEWSHDLVPGEGHVCYGQAPFMPVAIPDTNAIVTLVVMALRVLGAHGPAHAADVLDAARTHLSPRERSAVMETMKAPGSVEVFGSTSGPGEPLDREVPWRVQPDGSVDFSGLRDEDA